MTAWTPAQSAGRRSNEALDQKKPDTPSRSRGKQLAAEANSVLLFAQAPFQQRNSGGT